MTPEPPRLGIAGRAIGAGAPCFMVAEVGINHNGSVELAKECVAAAAASGADAVKFQTFRTEDFLGDRALTYDYVSQGRPVRESQYEMFKRHEFAAEQWAEIAAYCAGCGMLFFSTPTGPESLALLLRLGVPALKNSSDYLTHERLLRAMAATGLPVIVSTGMATLGEIDAAVRVVRETGNDRLALLHCTSNYPVHPADVHLNKIGTLRALFGCPVGFSDHSAGIVAALGAVALGAAIIEKHFTTDKTLPGPDHWLSADPDEFRALVDAVRVLEASLGESVIRPAAGEVEARRNYQISCVAARDLEVGRRLLAADIVFQRPGSGLPPRAAQYLVGRRVERPIAAGAIIALESLG